MSLQIGWGKVLTGPPRKSYFRWDVSPKKRKNGPIKLPLFGQKVRILFNTCQNFFPNLSGGTPNVISFIFTYRCRKNQKKLVTEINHQVSEISPYYCSYLSIPNPTYSSRFQRVSVLKRLVYNVFASPNPFYSLLHDIQRHKYMQTWFWYFDEDIAGVVGWEVFSIFQKIDLSHLFCSFEAPRINLRVIGDPSIMSLIYRDARIEGGGRYSI